MSDPGPGGHDPIPEFEHGATDRFMAFAVAMTGRRRNKVAEVMIQEGLNPNNLHHDDRRIELDEEYGVRESEAAIAHLSPGEVVHLGWNLSDQDGMLSQHEDTLAWMENYSDESRNKTVARLILYEIEGAQITKSFTEADEDAEVSGEVLEEMLDNMRGQSAAGFNKLPLGNEETEELLRVFKTLNDVSACEVYDVEPGLESS